MKKACLVLLLAFAAPPAFAQFGFRYTNVELRDAIRREKLDRFLVEILRESDIDCWITLTRDPNDDWVNVIWSRQVQLDPIVEFIGGEGAMRPAAFIFTASGERIAIVHEGDAPAIRATGLYKRIVTYLYNRRNAHKDFVQEVGRVVRQLNPKRIGLNYSDGEPVADGLTYGMKLMFDRAVGPDLAARTVSAEDVIASLWHRKTAIEVQLIEKSARQSAAITDEAFRAIVPGVTTARGLFNHIRRLMKEQGMEPGWQEGTCPTVAVSAFHLGRSTLDKVIERGDLIVVNSGFLVEGHMSDLNRVAYVLKDGETQPPPQFRKLFETCRRSVEAAVAKIRPGVTGIEVDAAARGVITSAGYAEPEHATGHTTGLWVHGLGVLFGPHWGAYGRAVDMKVHEGDIYAVEPAAIIRSEEHGGDVRLHLQEMVRVGPTETTYLTPPVTEIMLIK